MQKTLVSGNWLGFNKHNGNNNVMMSLEMPVPSQGHYGFHSFPVVD
jgi:hypothetical protein